QHRRRTAAAAGPGVHVLILNIVEQQAAVGVVPAHIHSVPGEEVRHDLVTQGPQVPGDHQVVVPGPGASGGKVGGQGVVGGGGHGRPHIIGVGDPLVHDFAAGDGGDGGAGALPAQDGAARRRGGPLGGEIGRASWRGR